MTRFTIYSPDSDIWDLILSLDKKYFTDLDFLFQMNPNPTVLSTCISSLCQELYLVVTNIVCVVEPGPRRAVKRFSFYAHKIRK